MATYILPGYEHVDGWHCGSTAISNACRYVGVELSEPMCFGLGAGAGFFFQGGAFRQPMYSRFLREAEAWLPELAEVRAAERMAAIGQRWTALALALKAISERDTPDGFEEAGAIAGEIADVEATFWAELATLQGSKLAREDVC